MNRTVRAGLFVSVFVTIAIVSWTRGAYGWVAFAMWAAGVNTAVALRLEAKK